MSTDNIKYYAVLEKQDQAVEVPLADLESNSLNPLAIYRVDTDINDMPIEDILIYLPAYHTSPNSVIRKAGISLYSGIMST